LGTLFEISTLIVLDGFIAELMNKMEKTEEDMKLKHNVLE
jgi:6-phospho-3-hexuloisomerase